MSRKLLAPFRLPAWRIDHRSTGGANVSIGHSFNMSTHHTRRKSKQQRLADATGRTVTMTTKVDAALIGGVVTRIGGIVYDGSVATRLAKVRDRLEQR